MLQTKSHYLLLIIFLFSQCNSHKKEIVNDSLRVETKPFDSLPKPYATKSVKNYCKVIGWPKDRTPIAPSGFVVSVYADSLQTPRSLYVTPNGDLLVAEANTESKGLKKISD